MADKRTTPIGAEKRYDERLYRRGPGRLGRAGVGLVAALVIAIGTYLAFVKDIPFVGAPYEATAVFENAANIRTTSPVRIAGVNVGEVTAVEPKGNLTEVTFTVNEEGLPLHTDTAIEIRPRLFLEGNFFLDVESGSPSAPELESGGTIPVTRTATAVQVDQVLTALQAPQRKNLKELLEGFGTALTHQPTAAEDADQDPDVRGESAAEAINDSFQHGAAAGRSSAIVNEALLGKNPRDLSRLLAAQRRVFAALLTREEQLKDLVTNFNVTTGALASESGNLSATVRELAPTLEEARPSLAHLSEALPPLRAFARELEPSLRELPSTIDAGTPWLRQTGKLLRNRELGGLARLLRQATPDLARVSNASVGLFQETGLLSRCATEVLLPTGDVVVDNAGGAYPFTTGQPTYREFFYGVANLGGAGQSFDGNGSYLRLQVGGGPQWVQAQNRGGGFQNETVYARTIAPPDGTRPQIKQGKPPFRPGSACHKNTVPDINGTDGADAPGDVGLPMPQAISPPPGP